jgi:hypothetical protein
MRVVVSELAECVEAQNQCQICFSTPDEGMSELIKLEGCEVWAFRFSAYYFAYHGGPCDASRTLDIAPCAML